MVIKEAHKVSLEHKVHAFLDANPEYMITTAPYLDEHSIWCQPLEKK